MLRRDFLAASLGSILTPALARHVFRGLFVPTNSAGTLQVSVTDRDWPVPIRVISGMIDKVNSGLFLGAPPGTVKIGKAKTTLEIDRAGHTRTTTTFDLAFRPDGWNNYRHWKTGELRPLRMAGGGEPYLPADFRRLPLDDRPGRLISAKMLPAERLVVLADPEGGRF